MRNFHRFPQDLVLQRLLAQDSLQFSNLLFQGPDLRLGNDLIIRPDGFLPTFAHATPPTEDQAGSNTMTAGYIGNRHSRLARLLDKSHLLLGGVPTPTLNTDQNFDSISTVRHSRMTRRKPSSYLKDYVRIKWGPLHRPTPKRRKSGYYFRKKVPADLKAHFGLCEIVRSLNTTSAREASALRYEQGHYWLQEFARVRAGGLRSFPLQQRSDGRFSALRPLEYRHADNGLRNVDDPLVLSHGGFAHQSISGLLR